MRPSIEGMEKLQTVFVANIRIDEFFDLFYSDKPFTLYGKSEQTFFGYFSKKTKNYNFEITTWDNPGPEFYSQVSANKFHNTPFTSKRLCEQDHKLPYIPLLPRSCHIKEADEIFWVNNQ